MTYKKAKGKTVICKDGAYFALSDNQVIELIKLLNDVVSYVGKCYQTDSRR